MAEFVRGGPSVSNSAKVRTGIIHPRLFIRYRVIAESINTPRKNIMHCDCENL